MAEKLTKKFNTYNGEAPLVMVYYGKDHPARGDTHGYIGVGRKVAEKLRARFIVMDHSALQAGYPGLRSTPQRLKALFTEKGMPDILFSRFLDTKALTRIGGKGRGLLVDKYNETLPSKRPSYSGFSLSSDLVPHHLTPERLEVEGLRFGEAFEELPRPFIGIVLAQDIPSELKYLAGRLGELKQAYSQATLFVCSCHRTKHGEYNALMNGLRKAFKDQERRFPIIGFNYKLHAKHFGITEMWNPYIGLIAQSDHLIVAGHSYSMVSEALAAGRSIYATEHYDAPRHSIKVISDVDFEKPLSSRRVKAVNMTSESAEEIIKTYKSLVAEPFASQGYTRIFEKDCKPSCRF